jgi:hypothetical protein
MIQHARFWNQSWFGCQGYRDNILTAEHRGVTIQMTCKQVQTGPWGLEKMESCGDSNTMLPHNTGPEGPTSNYVTSVSKCMKCHGKAGKVIQCSVNTMPQNNDS